jgi:dipeptidyl-peptidase-3
MKLLRITSIFMTLAVSAICNAQVEKASEVNQKENAAFEYFVEQFSDIKVLRYQIPGWENLTLKEQKLVYYLTQAGTSGRDIMWDQNYRYNLKIRKALEHIYQNYNGDKSTEDWANFETYLKRVWFSNGIHHHYSNEKIQPNFSKVYFSFLMKETETELAPSITAIL